MWLFVPACGFYSIVLKPRETDLTVRARVRTDLHELRSRYLPELTKTVVLDRSDYKYRATAPCTALARAMSAIVNDITYDNFKAEVELRQGHERELVYSRVWGVLHDGLPKLDAPRAAIHDVTRTDRNNTRPNTNSRSGDRPQAARRSR